ncbi:hypothetical protein [Gordonia sp. (in: high G+C Gram-positive bacteria)]|uniref:hypothetical protein n=1 Tax=unclassified Gordonia (in: high G+C Gram-positive bacteria) TaxID=2657482 RepID=UPI00260A1160|nr:hypothetical protein [Gordonia sp. (in: high G+C Gram-positive bacteria)]
MLDELEAQAREMYAAGEYAHALADFSVLREVRGRREGPYSVKYLRALHDSVRCMRHLALWQDTDLLCSELHAKYVRTHGPGEADTVDVAKHWAWAMVQLDAVSSAATLYVRTADALWDVDLPAARRLLGAAAVHTRRVVVDPLAGLTLAHTTELAGAFRDLQGRLTDDAPSTDFDGAPVQ